VTFGAAEYTAREAFAKKGIKKNKTEEALLSLSSYSLLLLFPDSALNFTILLLIIRKKNMSEGPSFEAACRTLEDMFPDLDPIVVRSVLDAKDGDMNETTTKLLAMSRSKRGGNSTSSAGTGGGYGDAPRSESMGGGGEDVNPYSRDAR